MNKILVSALTVSLFGLVAHAGPKFEITPMVGKKIYNYSDDAPRFDDGEALIGVRANAYVTDNVSLQLAAEASKDNKMGDGGKTDLERGMLNVQVDVPTKGKITPFVLVGGGYEKLHRAAPQNVDSQAFYNAGAGVRYSVNKRVDLVAEARVIHKVEDQDTDAIGSVGVGFKFGERKPALSLADIAARTPKVVPPVKASTLVAPKRPAPVAVVETVTVVDEPMIEDSSKTYIYDSGTVNVCELLTGNPLKAQTLLPAELGDGSSSQGGCCEPGYYVQVIALRKNSPDVIVSRLNAKGYPHALKREGSLTRVLVGPYASRALAVSALRGLKHIRSDAFIYHAK